MLDVGRIRVAVFNTELTLRSLFDLSQFAAGIFGEFLRCLSSIFGSLFDHGRFHGIQFCEFVGNALFPVAGHDNDALAKNKFMPMLKFDA